MCKFSFSSLPPRCLYQNQIKPIFLETVFDKVVKVINFIKSPPLSTQPSLFCVTKRGDFRKHFCHPAKDNGRLEDECVWSGLNRELR